MITIKYYSTRAPFNSTLIPDCDIEGFLLNLSALSTKPIMICQISVIYVLRKLIAENKIKHDSVSLFIDDTEYHLNEAGRFTQYPYGNDLFDDSLNAILSRDSYVKS